MRILAVAIYGAIAFASGVVTAPVVNWFVRSGMSGEVRCAGGICVGEPIEEFGPGLANGAGGLDAAVCGVGQQSTYSFWPDYVFGEGGCEEPRLVIMQSPEWQTNFEIENGRVSRIVRYVRPSFDP
jgi:hypothetical protein